MKQKQFYTIGLFSIVAIVGIALLVMNSSSTGMISFKGKSKFLRPYSPQPLPKPGPDLREGFCMQKCQKEFDNCMENSYSEWLACMSRAPTDVCQPPYEKSKQLCYKKTSLCEANCRTRYG